MNSSCLVTIPPCKWGVLMSIRFKQLEENATLDWRSLAKAHYGDDPIDLAGKFKKNYSVLYSQYQECVETIKKLGKESIIHEKLREPTTPDKLQQTFEQAYPFESKRGVPFLCSEFSFAQNELYLAYRVVLKPLLLENIDSENKTE